MKTERNFTAWFVAFLTGMAWFVLLSTDTAFLAGYGKGASKQEQAAQVFKINHAWCLDKKHYCGGGK